MKKNEIKAVLRIIKRGEYNGLTLSNKRVGYKQLNHYSSVFLHKILIRVLCLKIQFIDTITLISLFLLCEIPLRLKRMYR